MLHFIAGIGIPGSGKTTFLKNYAEEHGFSYIGSDDMREEFIEANLQDEIRGRKLWEEIKHRITHELGQGKSVVFDATLFKSHYRTEIANWARECGAEKVEGLFFDTPSEIAKERNASREKVVPNEVIDAMSESLTENEPTHLEGFDMIKTLDEHGELKELDIPEENVLEYKPKIL